MADLETISPTITGTWTFGTKYWVCGGNNFIAENPDVDDVVYDVNGKVTASADGITLFAPVFLPDGAVITSVTVDGDAAASAETWELVRSEYGDPTNLDVMASANIGSSDTSIFAPTVDGAQGWFYFIRTSSIDTGDEIYGATITYTMKL